MQGWIEDKKWADQCMTHVKEILGRALFVAAPFEEDQLRNTDLVLLRGRDVRIAGRIRRPSYFQQFRSEFTIRRDRPSGNVTELEKIINGFGDYFLYGFASESHGRLMAYGLGDLSVFRDWYFRQFLDTAGNEPGEVKRNNDGSSDFAVYRWSDLPAEFVVDSDNIGFEHSPSLGKRSVPLGSG
jgi:hypothetical protein